MCVCKSDLANTAWAFATLRRPDEKLFTVLARATERRVSVFKVQNLANTAWSFATVGQQDEQLFKAMTKMAEQRLDQFKAQDLANTAWAFAMVGQSGELLFASLATIVTLGQLDASLFAVLAREAEPCTGYLSAQVLCMIVWASSRRETLSAVWSLFEHVKHKGQIWR